MLNANLEQLRELALQIHSAAGLISLVAFWIVIFLQKKTLHHKKVGYIFLIALLGVLVTSLFRYIALKRILHFSYLVNNDILVIDLTALNLITILDFLAAIIPIWIITKKNEIANLQKSYIFKAFFAMSFFMLFFSISITFYFRGSSLFLFYGLVMAPYILVPILIFFWRIIKRKVSWLELQKFHILALFKSGIILNTAFLSGGASMRLLHVAYDKKNTIIILSISFITLFLSKNKIFKYYDKYFKIQKTQ